jgi:hypothetical protein
MQDRAGLPLSNSVQTPQMPCSQPKWVPVSERFSRRKSARFWRDSTSADNNFALTLRLICFIVRGLGRVRAATQRGGFDINSALFKIEI